MSWTTLYEQQTTFVIEDKPFFHNNLTDGNSNDLVTYAELKLELPTFKALINPQKFCFEQFCFLFEN